MTYMILTEAPSRTIAEWTKVSAHYALRPLRSSGKVGILEGESTRERWTFPHTADGLAQAYDLIVRLEEAWDARQAAVAARAAATAPSAVIASAEAIVRAEETKVTATLATPRQVDHFMSLARRVREDGGACYIDGLTTMTRQQAARLDRATISAYISALREA